MTALFLLNRLFLHHSSNKLAILAENWEVYSGVESLDKLPKPYRVKRILLSELYNSDTNDYDVALLKLAAPVVFDGQSGHSYSQMLFTIQVPVIKNPQGPNRSSYAVIK